MDDDPRTLVSTDWLESHLRDPDLRVIDASWYLPDEGRDARAEYAAAHVPGARFVEIDELSDSRSSLPHMAPAPEKFMSRMRALGIGDGHQVVAYDGAWGWSYKPGRIMVGCIVHGDSFKSGHGPGVMTLLAASAEELELRIAPRANLASVLKAGRSRK